MVGVDESEERCLAWMVDEELELDLGAVKLAALPDVTEIVEQR